MPENKYIEDELYTRNRLSPLLQVLNQFLPRNPIAYSRITRTPVVQGMDDPAINATYNDLMDRIVLSKPYTELPEGVIRHESIHAINNGLDTNALYTNAAKAAGVDPKWYGSDSSFAKFNPPQNHSNEALAYLGESPFINENFDRGFLRGPERDSLLQAYIDGVNKLDPKKAAQLRRLIQPSINLDGLKDLREYQPFSLRPGLK